MRKYLCVLMSIILCLTVFCSCSGGKTADVAESTNVTSTTASEQTADAGEVTVEATTEAQSAKAEKKIADKEISKKETTKKGEKASTTAKSASKKENKKTTAASKSSTKAQSNYKSNSKVEKTASVSTAKSENGQAVVTSKSENKVTQTTSSEINCSITIECKSILDNMDDLKKGHESYVPKNGIMLENYKTTLKSKSTVYDLLKKACKNNNITYTEDPKTMFGTYIIGINNIDQKDCGEQSGWMYSVNGIYPNVSVDSKKLKDGDKVVFTYTCSYKK